MMTSRPRSVKAWVNSRLRSRRSWRDKRSHHVDHGMVELGRFVHEGFMTGLIEPEKFLRRCGQHIEVRHTRFGRHPVIATSK